MQSQGERGPKVGAGPLTGKVGSWNILTWDEESPGDGTNLWIGKDGSQGI